MSIYDKKLGYILNDNELGNLREVFEGEVKLVKITYTIQDKSGVTADLSMIHSDFIEEEEEEEHDE